MFLGDKKQQKIRVFGMFCVLSVCTLGTQALARSTCAERAKTDFEKLYCDIQAEGLGNTLPDFEDFRKNTPVIQRLLLMRPASQLGLALPEAKAAEPDSPSMHEREGKRVAQAAEKEPKPIENASESHRDVTFQTPASPGCVVQGVKIECGSTFFNLVVNRPNSVLPEWVLTEKNRLALPKYKGNVRDEAAVRAYLKQAYQHYIDKMLSVGLAGSTMSFTTFYYHFKDEKQHPNQFSERFEKIFDYLKQDRLNVSVNTRVPDKLPRSYEQCGALTQDIIVCDDALKNWVYVRHNGFPRSRE